MGVIVKRDLVPARKPGMHFNVPMEEYLRWDAVGSSTLEAIHRSPAHARFWQEHDEIKEDTTGAKAWGTALHIACLEPTRWDTAVAVLPATYNGRKKDDQAFREQLEATHEVVLKFEAAQEVLQAAQVVRSHRSAGALLAADGPVEVSVVVKDPLTGQLLKCRPDKLIPSRGVLLDWKTTRMESQRLFTKQAFDLGYDRKVSFYLKCLNLLRELSPAPEYRMGAIVAVQNDQPFETCVYAVRGETLSVAEVSWRKDLELWAGCRETGVYPAFDEAVQLLDLPDWAKKLRLADAGAEGNA